MILRPRSNKMDLQRGKQMLGVLKRQLDHLRLIFGHRRATANLMNADSPPTRDIHGHTEERPVGAACRNCIDRAPSRDHIRRAVTKCAVTDADFATFVSTTNLRPFCRATA
jgi:hypothetical protein